LAVHKPARLAPGARIGVIAPAGYVRPEMLQSGIAALAAAGFAVELGANVYQEKGYLAGDAAMRAADLVGFFKRKDIDAIFCARGGFGSIQLLPFLSTELSRYPKIFVGYSDVTVLLNCLHQCCGMMTFHGPMVAEDIARGLTDQGKNFFWPILLGAQNSWAVKLGATIRPGRVNATLMGGCLSMLVTTLGTPYEVETRGKLLFIEDVGERPYRIERMLTHLKMAGKLDHVAGVVFGDFTKCDGEGPRDIREIVSELFRTAPYPVMMGLSAGHGAENLMLPFGAEMRLDSHTGSLELLESPVS
jgi:muramoyltetrapeptide carboxypeptidase